MVVRDQTSSEILFSSFLGRGPKVRLFTNFLSIGCVYCLLTGLFESGDVDDLLPLLQAASVEEPDDLTDGLAGDQLGAGQHSLH